jgi:hypothetical protein
LSKSYQEIPDAGDAFCKPLTQSSGTITATSIFQDISNSISVVSEPPTGCLFVIFRLHRTLIDEDHRGKTTLTTLYPNTSLLTRLLNFSNRPKMAIKSAPVPMMTCAMSAGLHSGRGDTMLFAAIDKVVVGREGRAVIAASDG